MKQFHFSASGFPFSRGERPSMQIHDGIQNDIIRSLLPTVYNTDLQYIIEKWKVRTRPSVRTAPDIFTVPTENIWTVQMVWFYPWTMKGPTHEPCKVVNMNKLNPTPTYACANTWLCWETTTIAMRTAATRRHRKCSRPQHSVPRYHILYVQTIAKILFNHIEIPYTRHHRQVQNIPYGTVVCHTEPHKHTRVNCARMPLTTNLPACGNMLHAFFLLA